MITYELIGSNEDHLYFDNQQYGILRDELSGISGLPCEAETISSPGQIGEIFTSIVVKPRTISLHVAVLGHGRAELEERRRRLIRALNPINGLSTFIWNQEDGSRMLIRCRPDSGFPNFEEGTAPDAMIWDAYLDLIADDPCYYAETEIVSPLRGFTGGWHLPLQFPMSFGGIGTVVSIQNPGDTPSPCTIELRGKLVEPVITNLTTGESIAVRRTIEVGEVLKVTTAFGNKRVTLIDVFGTETNAMHYVTISSRFFQIPPGTVRLRYTASEEGDTAIGYIRYVPRWLGQ